MDNLLMDGFLARTTGIDIPWWLFWTFLLIIAVYLVVSLIRDRRRKGS